MEKVYFLLGIHNHQPVGNFPEVFEKAFNDAYGPYMEVMKKHTKIKWSLHCSGILWDFFSQKHPEYMDDVKHMVDEGRLELISGGYYEPIMSVIPDRDKKGQIQKLTNFLKEKFNYSAKGLWLAERVWEPHLAEIFREAGIEYTIVDDAHFSASGLDVDKLKGYFVTEEQGSALNIFPISQKMRYHIPFKPVEKTIEYLSSIKSSCNPAVVMADDGEKFGLWPGTFKHVYQEGWLDRFFTELEKNSDWIETATFSEYMNKYPPQGRIYLPCASYFEMSEWSLPADAQLEFDSVVRQYENQANVKRFLRGGFWRNFLTKYAESNNMHKKMLYLSDKIYKKNMNRAKKVKSQIVDFLYAGQCNCAYWHGVFGGLYLPHLRNAVYRCLIEVDESLKENKPKWVNFDFDRDGENELLYESRNQNLYFSPHKGGALFEWDIFSKKVNLSNVLTRRYEAYHKRLKEFVQDKNKQQGDAGVKTIHDMVSVKEGNLDKYLNYDWYQRASLLDHFLHPETTFENFSQCKYGEQGDFVTGRYESNVASGETVLKRSGTVWLNNAPNRVSVEKHIFPGNDGLKVSYVIKNLEDRDLELIFAVEFNFAFSYVTDNESAVIKDASSWKRKDEGFGFELRMEFSRPVELWTFPLETVSLSESGFERTYQGTAVAPKVNLKIPKNSGISFDIEVQVKNA